MPRKKVPNKIHLNFSLLPDSSDFHTRSILIRLPEYLEKPLIKLPKTLDRINDARWFAAQINKQSDLQRASAYLRAALVDFYSIVDVQKKEIKTTEATGREKFDIVFSKNPILHLLVLMRNLSVHVRSSSLEIGEIDVSVSGHYLIMTIFIDPLVPEEFKSRETHSYCSDELTKLVEWFNENQCNWGVGDMVRLGTELLAKELITHHGF